MVCFGLYTKTDNLASYSKLKRNKKKVSQRKLMIKVNIIPLFLLRNIGTLIKVIYTNPYVPEK